MLLLFGQVVQHACVPQPRGTEALMENGYHPIYTPENYTLVRPQALRGVRYKCQILSRIDAAGKPELMAWRQSGKKCTSFRNSGAF